VNGSGSIRCKGVLEHLAGGIEAVLEVLVAANDIGRDVLVRAWGVAIEETQAEAHAERVAQRVLGVLEVDQALVNGLRDIVADYQK
jgi:hypothetical protein